MGLAVEIVLFCVMAAALSTSVLNAKQLTLPMRVSYWRVIYVMLCVAVATDIIVHSVGDPGVRAPGWAVFFLGIGLLPVGIRFHRLSVAQERHEKELRELERLLRASNGDSSEEPPAPLLVKSDVLRGVGTVCWLFCLVTIPLGGMFGIANPAIASIVP